MNNMVVCSEISCIHVDSKCQVFDEGQAELVAGCVGGIALELDAWDAWGLVDRSS